MMMTSLACSVQAYSSRGIKKIPVTFTRGPPMEIGDVEIDTKGALYIVKAELAFGTFIVEGDEIHLEKQTGPLGITTYRLNSVTGEGMAISEGILTFAGGTFKGIIISKGLFGLMAGMPFPIEVTQKGVWHGDGEYQGWTLVLQYTSGDDPIEGYLLVPN
jgi:hypothetical protein